MTQTPTDTDADMQRADEPITTGWNASQERNWLRDSKRWRGEVLTGKFRHWCFEWDELPVDETCMEWPCGCFKPVELRHE